ncbi:anticodon-binding domain-containing protein [Dichotomocladium elegans]|nr:anticodon-binding domain-containing protein [Dichotomocladium elegans]
MEGSAQLQRRKSLTKAATSTKKILGRRIKCSTLASNNNNGSRKGLSFRIIKISHIKEVLSNEEDTSSDLLPINVVNVERLDARESSTLKSRQQRAAKMGVGVTKEAQDIFDALCKTLPCRWSNDTIVVLDEVIIVPPYHVDSCKANASSAASLARVKKVLEGERRRLERKQ